MRIGSMMMTAAALLVALRAAPALAQTQHELNMQAQHSSEAADKLLNTTYNQLMKKLDATAKKKLVAAELAWIKFRDLQAASESDWYRGGSMAPMIYSSCVERLTRERIKDLKLALEAHDN